MSRRIRTLKPELLDDAKTAGLSHEAFRMFVSLILMADDYGNLRGDPRQLDGTIFWAQAASTPIDDLLNELERAGLTRAYEAGHQSYIHLCGWSKHQRVDKPGRARVPGAPASTPILAARVSPVRGPIPEGLARDDESYPALPRIPCAIRKPGQTELPLESKEGPREIEPSYVVEEDNGAFEIDHALIERLARDGWTPLSEEADSGGLELDPECVEEFVREEVSLPVAEPHLLDAESPGSAELGDDDTETEESGPQRTSEVVRKALPWTNHAVPIASECTVPALSPPLPPRSPLPPSEKRLMGMFWSGAYQEGVEAALGRRWAFDRLWLRDLETSIETYCPDRSRIAEWLRDVSERFVRAISSRGEEARFWSGYSPRGLLRWLNETGGAAPRPERDVVEKARAAGHVIITDELMRAERERESRESASPEVAAEVVAILDRLGQRMARASEAHDPLGRTGPQLLRKTRPAREVAA